MCYILDELAHMFHLTQPKFIFCDSDTIGEVRQALRSISMITTKLITVDKKVEDLDDVEDLLEPFSDEHLFWYV